MSDFVSTDEGVELLVELVRNACVNDGTPKGGHEHRSVDTLTGYLGTGGVVVEPHPGRQSVVYRVPGRDPSAPRLLLIPHLDVVPAREDEWTHPPFEGVRSDGMVWGRGTLDMLNLTAAMAAAFKRILEGEVPAPQGDVILAAVADEEAGGVLGAAHLVEERWDLVECEYVLTEVGAPAVKAADHTVIPVTVGEKGPAWRRLSARGSAGHASQPYAKDNALTTLAAVGAAIGHESAPPVVTEEWEAFLAVMPLDDALRSRLGDPERLDEAIRELSEDDPALARWIHACTHLTATPSLMSAGQKANQVPDRAELEVDLRKLPGQTDADVAAFLSERIAGDTRVAVESILDFPAGSSPTTGPLWDAIGGAAEGAVGPYRLAPALTPVATDARFFRARGAVAYGVGLFDERVGFSEMLSLFHGVDERVGEASVAMTANFLLEIITRFEASLSSSP